MNACRGSRRFATRVVLFSAGTALRPLLRNGIVPDFHCELENVPATVDALKEASKYGDLSQITLMASATVDPRIPPMFRETIYFFRDSVSSTQILGEKHLPIAGATPTCVNMALSMAAFLGFTDMALFGADCGIRPGSDDHAKDTVYRDIGTFQNKRRHQSALPGRSRRQFRRRGTHQLDLQLLPADAGRSHPDARSQSLQRERWRLHSGRGAAGAGSDRAGASAIDHAAVTAALKRALDQIDPATIFTETDLVAMANAAPNAFDESRRSARRVRPRRGRFRRRSIALSASFLERPVCDYSRTESIVSGTLVALPRIAMFFGFRIDDVALRKELFSLFINEFRSTVQEMKEGTAKLFERLTDLAEPALRTEREEQRRLA